MLLRAERPEFYEAFKTASTTSMLKFLGSEFGHTSNVQFVAGAITGALERSPGYYVTRNAFDRACSHKLLDTMQALDPSRSHVASHAFRFHLTSPTSDDVFGWNNAPDHWSWMLAPCVNFAVLRQIIPRRKAAVVVCMRDDGINIVDWLSHYRAIGFDHVFVYSNDNMDGSEWLLSCLAEHGIITLIESSIGNVSPQKKAFEHSLHALPELRDFEWVLYADSDEFLIPSSTYDHNIQNVLDMLDHRYPATNPAMVVYYWKWFVGGRRLKWSSESLTHRFAHSRSHKGYKTLVNLKQAASMRALHHPELFTEAPIVDADLKQMEAKTTDLWREPSYSGGQLNHYWSKSFEEFLVKKRRGDSISVSGNDDFIREYRTFFDWDGEESEANAEAMPQLIVNRTFKERRNLESLSGVSEIDQRLKADFPNMLQDAFSGLDVPLIYNEGLTKWLAEEKKKVR